MRTLPEYTVQNPRRHEILKETSQMRTICTDVKKSVCMFIPFMSGPLPGVVRFCRSVHSHTYVQLHLLTAHLYSSCFYPLPPKKYIAPMLTNSKYTEINQPEEC